MDEFLLSVIPIYQRFNDDERRHILFTLVNVRPPSDIIDFAKELILLTKRDFIGQLPAEVVDQLLTHFDYKTVLTACRVSKFWLTRIAGNSRLWKRICRLKGIEVLDNLISYDCNSDEPTTYCWPSERVEEQALESFDNELLDPSIWSNSEPVNKKLSDQYSPVLKEITYRSMFVRRMRLLCFFSKKFLTECITMDGHKGRITCIYYYQGLIATGSDDHTVRVWDTYANQSHCKEVISTGHSVSALKFDDTYLVTGSFNATVTLWDVRADARRIRNLIGHTEPVFCVDFCVDLDLLLSGSASSSIAVWSLSSGNMLRFINIDCKPRSINCLRVTNINRGWSADQCAVVVGNEHQVTILTIPICLNEEVDTYVWRKLESGILRVYGINKSQCLVTDVFPGVLGNDGRVGSTHVVNELVEIEEQTGSCVDPSSSQISKNDLQQQLKLAVCVKIVKSNVLGIPNCEILLLGAGDAFCIWLDRLASELNVVRPTVKGDLPTLICNLNLPSNVQWLIGRGPVATLCDDRWLNGMSESLRYQTLAAVALCSNRIAVFRMRRVTLPCSS